MSSNYPIPSASLYQEQTIKKSRFITHIAHTPSVSEAKSFIQQMKNQYPDARHHCPAFIAGAPDNSMNYGFSDDGEPSGTAGKPILAQLTGSGVGEITAVVVRYFGGIKLGTGGLVKAYGGSVQEALKSLKTVIKVQTTSLSVQVPFEYQNLLEQGAIKFSATIENRQYQQQLIATLMCPEESVGEFVAYLFDASKGSIIKIPN